MHKSVVPIVNPIMNLTFGLMLLIVSYEMVVVFSFLETLITVNMGFRARNASTKGVIVLGVISA